MSQRRRKLNEGDPIAPVAEVTTKGLHERDFYIGAAIASAVLAWDRTHEGTGAFVLTEEQVADRAVRIADAVMERKENAT